MKIELDSASPDLHLITAYSTGVVTVGRTAYRRSIIIIPDRIIGDWAPADPAALSVEHINQVVDLGPEVVLLGTGAQLRFPPAPVLEPLTARGIGLEVMDTGAACRSYNFLVGEGRRVAAALFMIEE